MKWALYALGTFVALIALVFVIGSSLAKQHEATRAARFHLTSCTMDSHSGNAYAEAHSARC